MKRIASNGKPIACESCTYPTLNRSAKDRMRRDKDEATEMNEGCRRSRRFLARQLARPDVHLQGDR